jgi:hypothetical protein
LLNYESNIYWFLSCGDEDQPPTVADLQAKIDVLESNVSGAKKEPATRVLYVCIYTQSVKL